MSVPNAFPGSVLAFSLTVALKAMIYWAPLYSFAGPSTLALSPQADELFLCVR